MAGSRSRWTRRSRLLLSLIRATTAAEALMKKLKPQLRQRNCRELRAMNLALPQCGQKRRKFIGSVESVAWVILFVFNGDDEHGARGVVDYAGQFGSESVGEECSGVFGFDDDHVGFLDSHGFE